MAYLVNDSTNNATYRDDYYILTADLDMSAHYWDAIGTNSYSFGGNFDGQGYAISGLYTQGGSSSTYSYQGLFGYINIISSSYSSTIENINIKDSYIQGYQFVGGIVGYIFAYDIAPSPALFLLVVLIAVG